MTDIATIEGQVEPAELDEQPTAARSSLTKDEIQAMVEESPDPQDKAAIMLVFSAGLQVNELTSLTWDDITDDAENPIKLRVTSTDATTRQILIERRLWNKYVAPLFFASMEGGGAGCTSTPAEHRIFPVSQQRIQQTIEEASDRAEIEKKVRINLSIKECR